MLIRLLVVLSCGFLLTACSIANLRPAALADGPPPNAAAHGRQLLTEASQRMGLDRLAEVGTYEVTANFDWSGFWSAMPMNSLPGAKNKDIRFRFTPGTFDGQLEFLEGPRTGEVYGIQSWEPYYRPTATAPVEKLNSRRYPWGLTAYHYIFETPLRLLSAPIVRYAGERTFEGQTYDLVFATWGDGTQRKDYDQYLVYVNQATGMVDLTELTITDFFLPVPNGMKNATVRYVDRHETSVGAWLPRQTVIQLGRPKAVDKDVYTYTLTDYAFDRTPAAVLYPMPDLPRYGDRKPEARR